MDKLFDIQLCIAYCIERERIQIKHCNLCLGNMPPRTQQENLQMIQNIQQELLEAETCMFFMYD